MSEVEARGMGGTAGAIVVRLRLVEQVTVDLERVPHVLGSPEAAWLGVPTASDDPLVRRFVCDLELHAGGSGPMLFRKAAVVSLGSLRRVGAGWVVPVEWTAATMTPLFPVLVGQLRIGADGIELDGHYAPPGGRLGYLLDVSLLGAAARGTGRWFLGKLAAAVA